MSWVVIAPSKTNASPSPVLEKQHAANPSPPHLQSPLLETSASGELPENWHDLIHEPQELRAQELEKLGYMTMAARVRSCGWTVGGFRTCKLRLCTECGRRIASRNADLVIAALATMKHPVEVFFSYRSMGLGAPTLRAAVSGFRHGLRLLRDRRVFAHVRAGIGAIETKLSVDMTVWLVHAHTALDIDGALDAGLVTAAWKKVTKDRGDEVDVRKPIYSHTAFGKYVTKADTWCPTPGSVPVHLLDIVARGVRGRRLLVTWGTKPKASVP